MFHIDGTQCDGDHCQHWSHSDKPFTFDEISDHMRRVARENGWLR